MFIYLLTDSVLVTGNAQITVARKQCLSRWRQLQDRSDSAVAVSWLRTSSPKLVLLLMTLIYALA